MIVAFLLTLTLVFGQISSSVQNIDTLEQQHSYNDACQFNVSQKSTGIFHTVSDVLIQSCTKDGGYEITLLDSEHDESLLVNLNSTIIIYGGNEIPTNWRSTIKCMQLIYLQQGILTLTNIEFHYSIINNSDLIISPSNNLISTQQNSYLPSLTVRQCTFQSVSWDKDDILVQMHTAFANRIQIDECNFNGISVIKNSNNSMMKAEFNQEIFLFKSKFQRTQVISDSQLIYLAANVEGALISILNCEFNNINLIGGPQIAALQILMTKKYNLNIIGNSFCNCLNEHSQIGALFIVDSSDADNNKKFIINENTFANNTGLITGGILFYTNDSSFKYNFNNNNFSNNLNNNTSGIGKDAYLAFSDPPKNWTKNVVSKRVNQMFSGSISDAKKDSIHFTTGIGDQLILEGSVTLTNSIDQKKISKGAIVGIVIGSIVIILAIVAVIIVRAVLHMKKKQYYKSTSQEKQSLLQFGQQGYV